MTRIQPKTEVAAQTSMWCKAGDIRIYRPPSLDRHRPLWPRRSLPQTKRILTIVRVWPISMPTLKTP
jgi:hypothetical protein